MAGAHPGELAALAAAALLQGAAAEPKAALLQGAAAEPKAAPLQGGGGDDGDPPPGAADVDDAADIRRALAAAARRGDAEAMQQALKRANNVDLFGAEVRAAVAALLRLAPGNLVERERQRGTLRWRPAGHAHVREQRRRAPRLQWAELAEAFPAARVTPEEFENAYHSVRGAMGATTREWTAAELARLKEARGRCESWSEVAAQMPGRSRTQCENKWMRSCKRRRGYRRAGGRTRRRVSSSPSV